MNRAIIAAAAIVFLGTWNAAAPPATLAIPIVPGGYLVENKGNWPKSWPKELEGLREQSHTHVGPLASALPTRCDPRHYAIPFSKREAFEGVWPHLLKVKSPGAPIVLKRGPSYWFDKEPGVCIHTPPEGEAPLADAKEASGHRDRTNYIELIVDGNIIDLNRIPLPPDTPIVDERFNAE